MRRFALLLAAAVALGACSSSAEPAATDTVDLSDALTVVASSPGSVGLGPQRVLLVAASSDNRLLGGPGDPVTVTFELDGESFADVPTEWVWGIEGVRGFYVANFDFPRAGNWQATLAGAGGSARPTVFSVSEAVVVPEVGTPAPPSASRTIADAPLEQLTSDPEPDPALYQMSVAEAVTSRRPSVIVFATPAFCTTAICGPTMDTVKEVAAGFPDVNWVHVEVYENIDDPQGELVETQAVIEWGLQTEPWVFVVDADGIVSARYEGTVGADELQRALAELG